MALRSGDRLAAPHVPGQRGEPQARQVLAQALGADPETLPLVRDDKGRPELSGPLAHYGTGWSHSGEVLLVALGEGVRLGVDLELLRPRPRLLEIVRRFFHPRRWLAGTPGRGRPRALVLPRVVRQGGHPEGARAGHLVRPAPPAAGAGADGALHLHWCDPELGEAARWHLHEWQASGQFRAALAWYPH